MILQYKHFLSVLDDILWVSIFITTVTISPNLCNYGVAVPFLIFRKSIHRFDLMSCDDGVVGIAIQSRT